MIGNSNFRRGIIYLQPHLEHNACSWGVMNYEILLTKIAIYNIALPIYGTSRHVTTLRSKVNIILQ